MNTSKKLPLSSPTRGRSRGFALLITITLLAFLVLLLVSLASLTRVETRVAANNQNIAQARQNALMALNIALGELQKHTGPDQRVTATADLQPVDPDSPKIDSASGVDLTASNANTAINTYWRNARNRRWTGVWKNSNTTQFSTVANDPARFNPTPELQAWLISGNEQTSTFTPQTALTGLSTTSSALDDSIVDANGVTHRLLVGPNTAGVSTAADLDRLVTAPQRDILATNVPGTNGNPTPVGHYAWWVGDEGVKARANLVDPYAAAGTEEANRIRLQSAQRTAIEAMSTNGADGLATTFPVNQASLLNIFTTDQLAYLNTATTFPAELKSRFHDLSVSSRGVLADPKHGGLKRDLSYILSRPNVGAFQTALKDAYSDTGYSPEGRNYNGAFSEHTTPYVSKFPAIGSDRYFEYTYEGTSDIGDPGIFTYSATWEQLWSFYNMGNLTSATPAGVFTAPGQVAARPVSATQQGIYPIVAKGSLFYRIRFDAGGTIWVDITPIIVLANPYNVTLSGEFYIKFSNISPQLRFGAPADPATAAISDFTTPSSPTDLENCYLGKIQLLARVSGIPPGEAQIFMVDPSGPSSTTIANKNDSHVVDLINDYDEDACLTYNTGKTLPVGKTHAVLYSSGNTPVAEVFMGTPTDYQNRVGHYVTHRPSTSGMENAGFLVNPVASGIQQGGGVWFTYEDGTWSTPQQATFYQVNYRALSIDSAGYGTPNNHPLHWMDTWVRYGITGGHASAGMPPANHFLAANLMLPPGGSASAATTRWGVVNNGVGNYFNTLHPAIPASSKVGLVNFMFDLPKPGRAITSLGQLQHFNTAGHAHGLATYSQAKAAKAGTVVHQWQVNYPISNSYPHPRVNRDQIFDMRGDFSYNYDGSYLWNDILWDRFYFSSYPQSQSESFDFATDKLVNSRYRPFRSATETPTNDETRFRGVYLAAQNLLADGAFNINSTSVEAWKAVLSSLKDVPIGSETASANLTAPFSRILDPIGGSTDAKTGISENAWNGFRNLTPTEINAIAEALVMQVRKRGPFLSLSEFVNRRLVTKADDNGLDLGLKGPLQAAIDSVVNQQNDPISAPFTEQTANKGNNNGRTYLAELAYRMPNRLAGFPGYLLQGDVLSAIGPSLAARSDTFTIRTYGDVVNPVDPTRILGRAWCEAVVQRTPDYVAPKDGTSGNAPDEIATDQANIDFGRRYQIVSFRWLSPEDI